MISIVIVIIITQTRPKLIYFPTIILKIGKNFGENNTEIIYVML